MEEQFPDYVVEDAFTSQMIIDRLRKRDGIFVSYVDDAVKYAAQHNVHNLVLQPTINGRSGISGFTGCSGIIIVIYWKRDNRKAGAER